MGEDPARLVYLVVLGLAVGFFALAGRRRWGKALRDLALWGLIFAMVIIAYGFRDVLRTELFPASTVALEDGSLMLRRGTDGHFHAELMVNDRPVLFLIDTGASDIVLSLADAAAAGIDVDALNFSGRARTANGLVATAPVRLASLRLGEIVARDVPASVNAGALDTSLLGMRYLDRFARIEISGDRMILHR